MKSTVQNRMKNFFLSDNLFIIFDLEIPRTNHIDSQQIHIFFSFFFASIQIHVTINRHRGYHNTTIERSPIQI